MTRYLLVPFLILALGACTQKTVAPDETPAVSTRFAKAELAAPANQAQAPEGVFRFEQMPNSTIVTYRLQGLEPKRTYQALLRISADCAASLDVDAKQDVAVYQFKVGKTGVSESTFKIENVSVSNSNPVIGKKMILSVLKNAKKPKSGTLIGCTDIVASDAKDHLQQLGGAPAETEK